MVIDLIHAGVGMLRRIRLLIMTHERLEVCIAFAQHTMIFHKFVNFFIMLMNLLYKFQSLKTNKVLIS